MQKTFQVSHYTHIGIGGQFGTNLIKEAGHKRQFVDFIYVNSHFAFFDDKFKIIAGISYGDKAFVGGKSRIGGMASFEYAVTDKFHLVGNWIVQRSAIGVGVLDFIYYVSPKIPLSFG